MGIFDWLGKKKELTLEEVRRQEKSMEMREQRALTRLEKAEAEREELFSKGAKIKSPLKRRQLARRYHAKTHDMKMMERDLQMTSRELSTISAIKLVLERKEMAKSNVSNMLHRINESELVTMLENDKISTDLYMEKLDGVLSTVTDTPVSVAEDLGNEGREILEVWEKMDEGEIDSFDTGLKMADRAVREPEREAETE